MTHEDWYEREEDDLHERFNRGDIDKAQFNKELRDLRDALRSDYEEERDSAIREVDDRWGY